MPDTDEFDNVSCSALAHHLKETKCTLYSKKSMTALYHSRPMAECTRNQTCEKRYTCLLALLVSLRISVSSIQMTYQAYCRALSATIDIHHDLLAAKSSVDDQVPLEPDGIKLPSTPRHRLLHREFIQVYG